EGVVGGLSASRRIDASNSVLLELFNEQPQCPTAMTELILLPRGQLGNRYALRDLEDRVVAKSTTATRGIDDASFPAGLTHQRRRIEIPAQQCQRTAITSTALSRRDIAKIEQQLVEIGLITG